MKTIFKCIARTVFFKLFKTMIHSKNSLSFHISPCVLCEWEINTYIHSIVEFNLSASNAFQYVLSSNLILKYVGLDCHS